MQQWLGQKGGIYVLIQTLIFAVLVLGPRSLPFAPQWSDASLEVSRFISLPLILIAGGLIISGLINLGGHLSVLPYPKKNAELIQTGAFAIVRHPIYSGLILFSLAWALFIGSTLMLIYGFILAIFFEFKTRREELELTRVFPDYEAYQKKVKKLIPFIY